MNKKVLISCPISNRDYILPYYLRHIYNLDYNKKNINIYWIINNSKPNDKSYDLLNEFKNKYNNKYNSIIIEIFNSKENFYDTNERSNSNRVKYIYSWLAILRNKILKKCVDLNCDYLFSNDSDILIRPDTLNRLLGHNEHIVSSLIYNGYIHIPKNISNDYNPIKNAYRFPNILKKINSVNELTEMDKIFFINSGIDTIDRIYTHISNYRIKFPEKNPINKLINVDYTGASILMSKDVCKKTRYEKNKVYGEDEPFCYSAKQAGFQLYCDVSLFQYHCMNQDILNYFLDNGFIEKIK